MIKKTLVSIILVLSLLYDHVNSLEFRYKVCTAEELRNYVESVCMRMGRDTNSVLSLSPYGTISAIDGRGLFGSEIALIGILRASRKTRPNMTIFKRSQDMSSPLTLDTCCQESCSIKAEDLVPHCTSI